ncbi:MAG: response regulator transcription factor [Chloroflexi bacterium]|nr:response regulator transcription factor [Chloroflexota bacterium]
MKPATILVVDDEPRLVRFVKANLESVGYKVLSAGDGATALGLAETGQPDLIILDIVMPDVDGYEVCRRIREFSDVPIVMLTAKGEEGDKVKGFDVGADDYVTKPFGAEELIARVKAVLRRSPYSDAPKPQPLFVCGDFTMDFLQHKVTVHGSEKNLSATEYKLLHYLVTNAGKVIVHEDLLGKVWGPEYREEVDYLRVYIHHLRQKIEDDPARPRYILSKPSIGYMFAKL